VGLGKRCCISALKYDIWLQQFNDFPANQLNKFRANEAELIPVQAYITVCHDTNRHYDCVYNQWRIYRGIGGLVPRFRAEGDSHAKVTPLSWHTVIQLQVLQAKV